MEYSPIFTNLDLCHIVKQIFESNSFDIVYGKNKAIPIKDFLNVKFYAFKYDADYMSYDGIQDMPENEIARIMENTNQSLCLVEQYNRETSFSENFEILNTTIKLTFAVQESKGITLDTYIQHLHEKRKGKYDIFEAADGKRYKYNIDFGHVETQGDTYQSPLGSIALYEVEVSLNAILNAIAYGVENGVDFRFCDNSSTPEDWPYDRENLPTSTYPLLFNEMKVNVNLFTKPNTIYQKATGQVLTSGSMTWTFTSYDFVGEENTINEIIKKAKMFMCSAFYEKVIGSPTAVDIKEDVILNTDLAVQLYEIREQKHNIVYNCILTSFDEDVVNTDFVKRTITLQLQA